MTQDLAATMACDPAGTPCILADYGQRIYGHETNPLKKLH